MQIAVRSSLTTGVALMGAGVIALSPVTHQPTPNLYVPALHASAVQLAAQVNPITQWGQIISEALQNTKGLVTEVLADPAPVLGQVVRNQLTSAVTVAGSVRDYLVAAGQQLATTPEALKQAFQQLVAGHVADAVQTLYGAVLTPIVSPILTTNILPDIQAAFRKPVQNMLNVIDTAINSPSGMGWVLAAGFPFLAVISDVVSATGDGLQNVVNAFGAKNLGAVIGAIVAMPGSITGALLNGYNGDGAGILGPNGILQGFRNALGIIATAIKPVVPPPVSAASVPAPASAMITLSTGEKATFNAKPAAAVKPTGPADKTAPEKTGADKVAAATDSGAAPAAAADAGDDSAEGAPAVKQDRRTRGAKSSSNDDAGAGAATTEGAKGADDGSTTPTHKSSSNPKRDRTKPKGGDDTAANSAGNSGDSHNSAGKSRGAGKSGSHRSAKAGGE